MSLYQLINGVNPAAFLILPMLGHHPDKYPRFRDCFTGVEGKPEYDDKIVVYTRSGGGNRDWLANADSYYDEGDTREEGRIFNEDMQAFPEYVTDFDDEFDSTYAIWVFNVPDKWKEDYRRMKEATGEVPTKEYQEQMKQVYPKLAEQFEKLWAEAEKASG